MPIQYNTTAMPPQKRFDYWSEVVSDVYFGLDIDCLQRDRFNGDLSVWNLGVASLSRNTADALNYRRLRRHLLMETEEHYLVTVPSLSEVNFAQSGSAVCCGPGGFILERSGEPYEFGHGKPNDLWVFKLPAEYLRNRIRAPDRFCALAFDATGGMGALFVDMLYLIPRRFESLTEESRVALGYQLADLLVYALKDDERTLTTGTSSVRDAHLTRVESVVRRHLSDPNLNPEFVAGACGISTRYLHALFRDTNKTFSQWVRQQRLLACKEALADAKNHQTVAEIAYKWGFADQAQFSRIFKLAYSLTPTDYRQKARPD